MVIGNALEDFPYDEVLARFGSELLMVSMVRIEPTVLGQGEIEHLRTHRGHFLPRLPKELVWRQGSMHDVTEFLFEPGLPQLPGLGTPAPCEVLLQPAGKIG